MRFLLSDFFLLTFPIIKININLPSINIFSPSWNIKVNRLDLFLKTNNIELNSADGDNEIEFHTRSKYFLLWCIYFMDKAIVYLSLFFLIN